MTPPVWQAVLIRAARTYVQGFLGFSIALGLGVEIGAVESAVRLAPLTERLLLAAELGVAPATIALLQNLVELLARLDERQPRLRG